MGAIWVSDPVFNRFDPEAGTYETRTISGFAVVPASYYAAFKLHSWDGTDGNEVFFNSREAREIAAAITKATDEGGSNT